MGGGYVMFIPGFVFLVFKPLSDQNSESNKEEARRRQEQAALKAMKAIEAVISYCEAPGCRRKALLAHFGEGTGLTGAFV